MMSDLSTGPGAAASSSLERNKEARRQDKKNNFSWVAGLGFLGLAVLMSLLPTALVEVTKSQRGMFLLIQVISIVGAFASSADWVRQNKGVDLKTIQRYFEVGAAGVAVQLVLAAATLVSYYLR